MTQETATELLGAALSASGNPLPPPGKIYPLIFDSDDTKQTLRELTHIRDEMPDILIVLFGATPSDPAIKDRLDELCTTRVSTEKTKGLLVEAIKTYNEQ